MCFNVFFSCYGTVSYGKFLVLRDVFPASFGMAEPFLVSPEKPGCQFPPIGEKETHQQQNSMENSLVRGFCAGGQHDSGEQGRTGQGVRVPAQEIWLPPQGQTQISCVIWGKGFNHWDSLLKQAGKPSILSPFFTLCVKPQVCSLPTGQPNNSRLQKWGHSPKALQARIMGTCRVPSALHSEVLFGPWGSKVMHGNNTKVI